MYCFISYLFFLILSLSMMKQAIGYPPMNDTVHDEVPSLTWNSSQYADDAVEHTVPNASKSATMAGAVFWPKNLATNLYEIPIDINGLHNLTRSRISYVVGYLERATLLSFRPPRASDTTVVKILERENDRCWSNVGKGMGRRYVYMNLHPSVCTTLHMYLHEFMHLLGFIHEHERPDAQNHYYSRLPYPVSMTYYTAFDSFSVMNYPRMAIGDLINPWLNEVSKGRRSFLSRCDWTLLLSVYPGKNIPPSCIPNYAPKVLKPSRKLLQLYNRTRSEYLCQYNNEWLYETEYCVTPNNRMYPNLSVELGFPANEYPNRRLRSAVYNQNVARVTHSDISVETQNIQNGVTYNANINHTIPENVTYSLFDRETCLLIYNALSEAFFIENCGPDGNVVCKQVSSPEDLRIWLKENFSQCFRPKEAKTANNQHPKRRSH